MELIRDTENRAWTLRNGEEVNVFPDSAFSDSYNAAVTDLISTLPIIPGIAMERPTSYKTEDGKMIMIYRPVDPVKPVKKEQPITLSPTRVTPPTSAPATRSSAPILRLPIPVALVTPGAPAARPVIKKPQPKAESKKKIIRVHLKTAEKDLLDGVKYDPKERVFLVGKRRFHVSDYRSLEDCKFAANQSAEARRR